MTFLVPVSVRFNMPLTNDSPSSHMPTNKDTQISNPTSQHERGQKRGALSEEERKIKHKKFLERNRLSAGKCRERKKQRVGNLEERYNATKHINFGMKERVLELEAEIRGLKDMLEGGHPRECKAVDFAAPFLVPEVEDDLEEAKSEIDMILVVEEDDLDVEMDEAGVRDEPPMPVEVTQTRTTRQSKRLKQAEGD